MPLTPRASTRLSIDATFCFFFWGVCFEHKTQLSFSPNIIPAPQLKSPAPSMISLLPLFLPPIPYSLHSSSPACFNLIASPTPKTTYLYPTPPTYIAFSIYYPLTSSRLRNILPPLAISYSHLAPPNPYPLTPPPPFYRLPTSTYSPASWRSYTCHKGVLLGSHPCHPPFLCGDPPSRRGWRPEWPMSMWSTRPRSRMSRRRGRG